LVQTRLPTLCLDIGAATVRSHSYWKAWPAGGSWKFRFRAGARFVKEENIMRIVVAGTLSYEGADCAEIIRGGRDHILASREEKGCVAYNWAVDPLESATIHVFEEWESPEALGTHFRDASYMAMRDHLGQFPMSGFDVRIYSASGVEPIYTDEGMPRDTIFGIFIGA
jgi:quinol monooxygenase YgiN